MGNISGTNLSAGIVPFTTDDTYATHESKYGKGGWKEVTTVNERNSIPTQRRTVGMAVYVISENKLYVLNSDLTTWTEFIDGGGVLDFEKLTNRPSYNGTAMTHTTNIPEVKTSTWDGKQDTISDLSTIRSGASLGATAVQPEAGKGLFSGNYNDLSNKPTIPIVDVNKSYVDTELAKKQNIIQASTLPIPSQENVGSIYQYMGTTSMGYTNGYFYKSTYNGSAYVWQQINVQPGGTTVVSWGNIQGLLSDQEDLQEEIDYLQEGIDQKEDAINDTNKLSSDLVDDTNRTHKFVTSAEKNTWNNKSDFSGNYNDLTNKPTIPTVGDGTITITQGGTTKGTFTTNQNGNTTINLDAGGSSISIDEKSITENTDNEIQAIGVIDQKTNNANKQWTGTTAEYNALSTKDNDTLYIITDDDEFATKTELNAKQDKLTAGANITIENNVISATGGGSDLPQYPEFDVTKQYMLMLIPNQGQTAYELKWREVSTGEGNQLVTSDNKIFLTSDNKNFIVREEL